MKVILLKDIAKLGKRGEIKEVTEGYGMNVLVKKGDALHATPAELAKWKSKEDSKNHKKELATSAFAVMVHTLKRTELVIAGMKRDEKGQLFAQIKDTDIAVAIFTTIQLSVDPKQIIITTPIKSLGKHSFTLKHGDKKELLEVIVK